MNNDSYTGVQKAAILLITRPEKAATIFKHLKEDEIEELTLEIANTRSVSPQTKEEVLEEFIRYASHSSILRKAVSDTQKNFWKKHSETTRHRELLQNLQHLFRFVRSNLSERQIRHSC